jgi:hypothetical protein
MNVNFSEARVLEIAGFGVEHTAVLHTKQSVPPLNVECRVTANPFSFLFLFPFFYYVFTCRVYLSPYILPPHVLFRSLL